MKKTSLLNANISSAVAKMGHTDQLTICDCGLPIPESANRIDLALIKGLPSFLDVLDAVLSELEVQKIILAEEIKEASPQMLDEIMKRFPDATTEFVNHEELKKKVNSSKAVIRTGECTSFANIILESGVTF